MTRNSCGVDHAFTVLSIALTTPLGSNYRNEKSIVLAMRLGASRNDALTNPNSRLHRIRTVTYPSLLLGPHY